MNPPPPPPPHGSSNSARGGLPEGNYDIFIIPPHSSGGGFLYLPSLQPHRNSFLAGVACTIAAVAIWSIVFPVLREWIATIMQSGGMGVIVLMMITAVGAWAWGKTQAESGGTPEGGTGGAPNMNGHSNPAGNSTPNATPHPQPPPPQSGPEPRAPPKPTWQRANTGPATGTGSANTGTAKGSWEKAREETRKREEERKKAEDLRKKREEDERERVRQREKDARERELREARERREKEAQERARAAPPPPPPNPRKPEPSRPTSPTKRHQQPTAKTATDDDAYSYRPYDEPKRSKPKTATASSIYSESSYAPSQSTSRTTPPPSHRGRYQSKDPDKILLKAVYSFNNTFTKLPIAQLVSGVGSVTDGLILRITTEGLFIDDDVRNVPQREWDVKAWTLKLVEVWCPHLHLGASSGSSASSWRTGSPGFFGNTGATKAPTNEELDAFHHDLMIACKPVPHRKLRSHLGTKSDTNSQQSGQSKDLHVLRANIRDQEGKRYVFILPEEEGWKVAVGLQRLRRGTQVRALGVSGMPLNEMKAILEGMGWT